MKSFIQYIKEETILTEAKFEMLDVSIQNGMKLFNTDKKIQEMMTKSYRVEEKFDGLKVNILRNQEDFDPSDYSKNWIISYKNFILYPFEHQDLKDSKIKEESYGNSQFKFIHNIIKKSHKKLKNIPINTEFFLEFLMKKPTTTRTYSEDGTHSVILISHSPTNFRISDGKIFSTPSDFIQRDEIAHEFSSATGINEPPIVFSGPLFTNDQFNEAGIQFNDLKKVYLESFKKIIKEQLVNKTYKDILSSLNNLFTSYGSSKGGTKIEGSVFVPQDGSKVFKFVAADQYSKETRLDNKKSLVGDLDEQNKFFSKLDDKAEEIVSTLNQDLSVEEQLKEASHLVYTDTIEEVDHSSKTLLNKQDDLYLKVKNLVIDLKDNSSPAYVKQSIKDKNGLGFFIGKLRIPTIAHFQIIKDALKKNPEGLILALVDTKKFGLPFEDRKTLIEEAFPTVKVIKAANANFSWVLTPFKNIVTTIFCGEDNKVSYTKQIETFNKTHSTSIVIDVMNRPEEDEVSATAVEKSIKEDDEKSFKKLTPKEVWTFWEKLKELINE